jgi:hypothetical protein
MRIGERRPVNAVLIPAYELGPPSALTTGTYREHYRARLAGGPTPNSSRVQLQQSESPQLLSSPPRAGD